MEKYNLDDAATFQKIVDNCFGNIFVTDGSGRIIYLNESSAASLGCPRDELLRMSVQDLIDKGLAENPGTIIAIRDRQAIMSLVQCQRTNIKLAAISTPVFDAAGNIEMVVTYSQTESRLNQFVDRMDRERRNMNAALSYLQSLAMEDQIVAESPATKYMFQLAAQVAANDSTVLLRGESGTGKEVLARHIHNHSPRSEKLFLPINCGAIPAELMESEFFGYEGGAFSGARKEGKAGFFEVADQGTIFLDEIGELPKALQAKLLRVLESGEFIRVGGTKNRKSNVRIISATNRDLHAMVATGGFREDLYYRINVVPIIVPPLRDRREDIMALADVYLAKFNEKYGFKKRFSRETSEAFAKYNWPGNVRELKNMVERLVVTTPSDRLYLNSSSIEMRVEEARPDSPDLTDVGATGNLSEYLARQEEMFVRRAVKECGGDVTQAAKLLGIHRSGLYKKLSRFSAKR